MINNLTKLSNPHARRPCGREREKQGWIHGNPVADGWAGAVMRKPIAIQKYFGRTDGPTDTARCRVACPRLKSHTAIRLSDSGLFSWSCLSHLRNEKARKKK